MLVIGNTEIPFTVARSSKRKKTIALTIDADSGVTILAPDNTDFPTIERLARKRSGWIIRKLSDLKQCFQVYHPREFVSGETVSYLGRQYRLKIQTCEQNPMSCKLKGRWVEVTIPSGLSDQKRIKTVSSLLVGWYKRLAAEKICQRTDIWSKRLGIEYRELLVTNPEKRWGSCDSQNNLRFNWRIIMAPLSLVDYVIVHELCHVVYKNHSADFWRLLGSLMPDYELRKSTLKLLGAGYSL